MRVLVGMETSGAVRSRLRALGVDAWSCDLLPADDGSPFHIQGNVFDVAHDGWSWALFHPTCTYLTISAEWAYGDGPYHQKVKPGTLVGAARRKAREQALDDFRRLLALPYPKAIENPIGAVNSRIRKPDQVIQPHWFGDDASKATCLWLDRMPKLRPTGMVAPRMVNGRPRWGNQTDGGQNKLSPGPDRWKERSKTWPGVADAMARQWFYYFQMMRRAA